MQLDDDLSDATQVYSQSSGGEWSVSVTDDDQRNMSPVDIALAYARGTLSLTDTFVWREGMTDWLPLGNVPDLMELIAQAPAVAPAPAAAPAADPSDLAGTMMLDSPAPMPAPEAAPAAARRAVAPSVDVFQARAQDDGPPVTSPSQHPDRMTGARNEASALFSLSDLHAAAAARTAPAKTTPSIQRSHSGPPARRKKIDDMMGLGSGDLGLGAAPLGGMGGAFAAPVIDAPYVPPPPPPQPVVAAQPALAGSLVATTPKRSSAGLMIGIIAAVVVAGGVGIFFAVQGGGGSTTASTASAAPTGQTGKTESSPGETTKTTETTTTEAAVAMNDTTSSVSAEEPGDAASSSAESSNPTSPITKNTAAVAPTTKETTTKTATSAAPTPTKSAEPPPPAGGGPFDADAARGQLSAKAGGAQGCAKPDGPTGKGTATVTFSPSGRATQATVSAPFAGTPVGGCVAAIFRSAAVPPFTGSAVQVSKSFFIK